MDTYSRLHNCIWGNVCKDMESPCNFQKCKNEEEGEFKIKFYDLIFLFVSSTSYLKTEKLIYQVDVKSMKKVTCIGRKG